MKIFVDTNILVRFLTRDNEEQYQKVAEIFVKADEIFIPTNTLCELVWVLSYSYKFDNKFIWKNIKKLFTNPKIKAINDEIDFGLKILEQNGDFADGINAISGKKFFFTDKTALFVSFDRKAVKILQSLGINSLLLQ